MTLLQATCVVRPRAPSFPRDDEEYPPNLFFACVYNAVGVPWRRDVLTRLGVLSPRRRGGQSFSSVSVIA